MFPTQLKNSCRILSLGLLLVCACTTKSPAPSNTHPAQASPKTESASPQTQSGELKTGQASGTFTAKGETVSVKYAYAGRAQRFGEDSVVVLLTDQEIPADALADEIKNQTMLLDGKIRGLEYVLMKDGYWVRYHPGQYQESKSPVPKELVIDKDIVKGSDEGDLAEGKYARSVKFAAAISK
jgi:hypothetical protein